MPAPLVISRTQQHAYQVVLTRTHLRMETRAFFLFSLQILEGARSAWQGLGNWHDCERLDVASQHMELTGYEWLSWNLNHVLD